MTMGDRATDWSGDWAAAAEGQRRAWLRTTADVRLRWLEDALTFAQATGALDRDRRRRAAEAARLAGDTAFGEAATTDPEV